MKEDIKKLDTANPDLRISMEKFNKILSTAPKNEYIKKHPMYKDSAGNALLYLPIDYYLELARSIFLDFRVEVLEVKQVANCITCTVRFHYPHPVAGYWTFQDGVGAKILQTKKSENPMDATAILADAVEKALPAAKSMAIKDALQVLGKKFGLGLNKQQDASYESLQGVYGKKINKQWEDSV